MTVKPDNRFQPILLRPTIRLQERSTAFHLAETRDPLEVAVVGAWIRDIARDSSRFVGNPEVILGPDLRRAVRRQFLISRLTGQVAGLDLAGR